MNNIKFKESWVTIPIYQLNDMLRTANQLGRNGNRVRRVEPIAMEATDAEQAFVWICDDGPQSATEAW